MNTAACRPSNRNLLLPALLLAGVLAPCAGAQTKFADPTPEELHMTSLPGYPGVAAVILNKEEITKDDLHSATHYARIKIFTDEGKKYANVEIAYASAASGGWMEGEDKTVDDIQGRTIHPDGTIVPFTGKPYLKTIVKTKGEKVQAKVFTLPDVTPGSIIEYRYATRINDGWYEAPDWIIQGDLYLKNAHYMWYPTSHELQESDGGGLINSISWFPLLPKDAQIVRQEIPGIGANGLAQKTYELTVHDVPPVVEEEYMPPLENYGFRVYFNRIAETSIDQYWKVHGKSWSKAVNSFANPNGDLKSATQQIIAGASTPDQKLRAIYAAVEKLENTDYTRGHEQREDKAAGLGKLNNSYDVFRRGRGDSLQLTELFLGMARAAGFEAEAMMVPDRSHEIFIPQWLSLSQFDAMIAIVNVDGKEQFFDPGERYSPYGRLAWQHTFVKGLRQKGNESVFADTPGDGYNANMVARVANLKMDAAGQITGKIDLTYSGAPALKLRHAALRGDDESLKHELRTSLEEMIPHTLEVKDVAVANTTDYENPLKVSYTVEGTLGTWTGKRLVLPADLFLADQKATFPHEKRDVAVDFNYPRQVKDALRIAFPSNFSVEAAPNKAQYSLLKFAAYGMTVEPSTSWFTTRREYDFAEVFVLPPQYPELRTFYSQFEANDQQSVVLKSSGAGITTSASASPAAN